MIERRVDIACVKDSKSRVLYDIAEAYLQIGLTLMYEQCIKKALELAK